MLSECTRPSGNRLSTSDAQHLQKALRRSLFLGQSALSASPGPCPIRLRAPGHHHHFANPSQHTDSSALQPPWLSQKPVLYSPPTPGLLPLRDYYYQRVFSNFLSTSLLLSYTGANAQRQNSKQVHLQGLTMPNSSLEADVSLEMQHQQHCHMDCCSCTHIPAFSLPKELPALQSRLD